MQPYSGPRRPAIYPRVPVDPYRVSGPQTDCFFLFSILAQRYGQNVVSALMSTVLPSVVGALFLFPHMVACVLLLYIIVERLTQRTVSNKQAITKCVPHHPSPRGMYFLLHMTCCHASRCFWSVGRSVGWEKAFFLCPGVRGKRANGPRGWSVQPGERSKPRQQPTTCF